MNTKRFNWFNLVAGLVFAMLVGLIVSAVHWIVGIIAFVVVSGLLATNNPTQWVDDGGPS